MKQIRGLNGKRMCDLSDDRKAIFIRRKDSMTVITAEKDCRLKVTILRQTREK